MPRRRYDPRQEAAIAVIEGIHAEHIKDKLEMRAEIERAYKDKMTAQEIKKSLAMNAALALGVAKTDIGRAIGTSNFQTIKELLARTAGDATLEDLVIDPLDERYTFTPATGDSGPRLTVTLTREELESTYGRTKWDAISAAEYGLDKLDTAEFEWVKRPDGSYWLRPVTPVTSAEMHGNLHPAVWWIDENDGHTAEAIEYLNKQLNR